MSNNSETTCVVCFKDVDIYSIGNCDHAVCHECSTRMRVLCQQNECPICRQELPKVIFTRNVQPYSKIQHLSNLQDSKYKIIFEDESVERAFTKLLEHHCKLCPNKPVFKNFHKLRSHMRNEHALHYCELCSENLKIFTSERRCYTRNELAHHRRKGDLDDRSHRGHPLCEFCDVRYMDNDELFRHLRRDHLYCHFCDADGQHLYYSSYDDLLDHFRSEHYLCEEGACIDEKFTPVFRTDIDLKAHKASAHSRSMGKAAAKQARTLEVEFRLKPRPRAHEPKKSKPRGQYERDDEDSSPEDLAEFRFQTPNLNLEEFPSLSGNGNSSGNNTPLTNIQPSSAGLTIHAVGKRNAPLAVTDENFPALSGDMAGKSSGDSVPTQATSVRLNFNSDRSSGKVRTAANAGPTNLSIHVNRRPRAVNNEQFPALASSSSSSQLPSTSKWVSTTKKKTPQPLPPQQQTTSLKPTRTEEEFPSLNPKFTTNLNFIAKEPIKSNFVSLKSNKVKTEPSKASSLEITVTNGTTEDVKKNNKKKKNKNIDEKSDTAKKKDEDKKIKINDNKKLKTKKRSELNVGTLNDESMGALKTEKVKDDLQLKEKLSLNDIPSQSSTTNLDNQLFSLKAKTKAPPPGFGPTELNPPFYVGNSITKPPPGFNVQLNSVARPTTTNDFTFTNSSGQSYQISAKNNNYTYMQPDDFNQRNQSLVTKVSQILLNNLQEFVQKSSLFRQGTLSAENYFNHCLHSMGEIGFQEVFPELLVLLPDINKQTELFKVFNEKKFKNKPTGKKKLESCETCRQVITNADYKQHLAKHALDNNFPSLS